MLKKLLVNLALDFKTPDIWSIIDHNVLLIFYFLHLKTLDILLLIVNITVADDAFYK